LTTAIYQATGKRKTSVASIRLVPGSGKKTVNDRALAEYLGRETLVMLVEQPLELLGMNNKLDVICRSRGGGLLGQAGAIRLGIARALAQMGEEYAKALRKGGFLTRDPRMVERKKYGQVKARKRYQYSKR
jgi:small subunit ribosomal protein S9